jgi:hypothetical protein
MARPIPKRILLRINIKLNVTGRPPDYRIKQGIPLRRGKAPYTTPRMPVKTPHRYHTTEHVDLHYSFTAVLQFLKGTPPAWGATDARCT